MAFLVKMLGCRPNTTSYTVLCVLLLRFVLPGKWPVYCIGSNITSLCGVVRFATCLTGKVESSRFSANFVIVGVRVVCVTVEFSSIIWIAFNLLFVSHSVHLSFIRMFQTFLALIPFRGVSQSFHTCCSPTGPDLWISSGLEAFWQI